jgi:hypothetical protein
MWIPLDFVPTTNITEYADRGFQEFLSGVVTYVVVLMNLVGILVRACFTGCFKNVTNNANRSTSESGTGILANAR